MRSNIVHHGNDLSIVKEVTDAKNGLGGNRKDSHLWHFMGLQDTAYNSRLVLSHHVVLSQVKTLLGTAKVLTEKIIDTGVFDNVHEVVKQTVFVTTLDTVGDSFPSVEVSVAKVACTFVSHDCFGVNQVKTLVGHSRCNWVGDEYIRTVGCTWLSWANVDFGDATSFAFVFST